MVVDSSDRENEATLYFNGRVTGETMEGELVRGVGSARSGVPWRAVKDAR